MTTNRKEYMKEYRELNKEKITVQRKFYYEKNKDKIAEREKEYRKNNKDKISARFKEYQLTTRIFKKYGLTKSDYDTLVLAQGGVCAICGKEELSRPLSVDHDHATGKVRGLLCNDCNRAIGMLKDDVYILKSAIEYLERDK